MTEPNKHAKKTKVCILGAGPAGLAAAYGLSNSAELRSNYDVTIYQVGWRAGGKCSTGREMPGNHIEQNCAHYLFGCYDNTFAMFRQIYKEVEAAGHSEFGDFDKVLLPRDLIALKQKFKGNWETWLLEFPANSARPGGSENEYLSGMNYAAMTLEWILESVFGWKIAAKLNKIKNHPKKHDLPPLHEADLRTHEKAVHASASHLLSWVLKASKRRHNKRSWLDKLLSWSLKRLRSLVWFFEKKHVDDSLKRLRMWSLFDYGVTIVIGILDDQILHPGGFESIDKYDFCEWLTRHGATKYAIESPFVTLWYQNSLAYVDGDTSKPSMSAAIGLLAQMRACYTYKGNVAYSLQNEVADTLISPQYIALKDRGVKFNFFHRLRELVPNASGDKLVSISIERQVKLLNGQADSYQPFTDVKGLPCWPNSADSKQFSDADRVRFDAGDFDLESYYTTWRGKDFTLKADEDFDHVIFAMPHCTIPEYCSSLYKNNSIWKNLVDFNPTVESQSLRLWFKPDLECLGWPYPEPILSAYETPYCTWEDDSQLLDGQTWDPANKPKTIACIFGPLAAPKFSPGPSDQKYIPAQRALVDKQAENFEHNLAGGIWSNVGNAKYPNGLDPNLLVLKSRRANSGPLQRYTMTWPGALQHRPKVDQTGVHGLVFAGDWVRNGLEAGSMEGATMAGLQASRAICGSPVKVIGEDGSYE